MNLVCDCSESIKEVELWFLKDIKDFTARKLVFGKCRKCHRPVVSISEKRILDNQTFIKTVSGNDAMRIINSEFKRMLCKYYKIDAASLTGWVYGVNKEIKNKQGQTTQLRQYSSDFRGNKKLIKKIST